MRYRIVNARTRVQHQALSHAFDEVRGRLREAASATNSAGHRLQILVSQTIRNAHLRADALNGSLAPAQLRARLGEARARFDSAYTGCNNAIESQIADARKRLGLAAASLDALSPLSVLQRGYAIAQDEKGVLVRDANQLMVGDALRVKLAQGALSARVEKIEETLS